MHDKKKTHNQKRKHARTRKRRTYRVPHTPAHVEGVPGKRSGKHNASKIKAPVEGAGYRRPGGCAARVCFFSSDVHRIVAPSQITKGRHLSRPPTTWCATTDPPSNSDDYLGFYGKGARRVSQRTLTVDQRLSNLPLRLCTNRGCSSSGMPSVCANPVPPKTRQARRRGERGTTTTMKTMATDRRTDGRTGKKRQKVRQWQREHKERIHTFKKQENGSDVY